MTISAAATRQIIEDLYHEALILADEARAAFDARAETALAPPNDPPGDDERIALSVEGLRTTTRLMHVLAWLLNQRAYLSGELTEFQVREHSRLPGERPPLPGLFERLHPDVQDLIAQSQRLHGRVERLDRDWRAGNADTVSPVGAMHGRLARAFGT